MDVNDLLSETKAIIMGRNTKSSLHLLQDKINQAHISKVLDIIHDDKKRGFVDIASARRYNLLSLAIILSFSSILIVFLAHKDLLTHQDIVRFGSVLIVGFGYKSSSRIK